MEGEANTTSFYDCLHVKWKHGYEKEYFWISGILLSLVATIGLLGNIFTLLVLCRPQMRKKVFYNLLFALACFDILFILSYGVSVSYKSLACYPFEKLVGSLAYPFLGIGLVGSIYMTVAISLERYLGICHSSLKFRREAWVFIVPVLVITLGYNFPKFLERRFLFVNGTLVAEAQEFRGEEGYKHAYNLWANIFIVTVIPLSLLLFLNGSIISTIKKTSKTVKELGTNHQKQGANTTKILFWIVLIFLVLHAPRMSYKCLFYLGPEDKSSWYLVRPLARLALITNSSVNFVIYCLVGKNFRKEFVEVFRLQTLFSKIRNNNVTNV